MAKKRSDYLDVDAFISELEQTLEDQLLPNAECCPRCGSDTWQELYYNTKTGRPNRCDECKRQHSTN